MFKLQKTRDKENMLKETRVGKNKKHLTLEEQV